MYVKQVFVSAMLAICCSYTLAQEVVQVTADDLARSWSNNQLAAEMKYGKKPLQISGVVDRISSAGDRYYVAVDAAGTFLGISVYVRPDALDDVAELTKGQLVTMYCENFEDVVSFQCHNGYVVK